MLGNMFTACLILYGKKNIKNNKKFNYEILFVISYKFWIFEFLVFFIIGKNKPNVYKIIINKDAMIIPFTAFIFISIYFSLSLGNNSTKLQGLWFISSWYFKIPSQASVTPPEDPGKANIYFPFPNTAQARDCIADVPTVL